MFPTKTLFPFQALNELRHDLCILKGLVQISQVRRLQSVINLLHPYLFMAYNNFLLFFYLTKPLLHRVFIENSTTYTHIIYRLVIRFTTALTNTLTFSVEIFQILLQSLTNFEPTKTERQSSVWLLFATDL